MVFAVLSTIPKALISIYILYIRSVYGSANTMGIANKILSRKFTVFAVSLYILVYIFIVRVGEG